MLVPVLAWVLLLVGAPLHAQQSIAILGRVVRRTATDTVAVSAVPLTLHRISRTVQGTVDSGQSGNRGEFSFRFRGDTAALYLVSARYAGIEYFSAPIRPPGARDALIVVSDTSSTAAVRLSGRHIIVRPPDASGSRAVLDLVSLQNDDPRTRVATDSNSPTWEILLPAGAVGFEVQEGDVSPSAIQFRGDTMRVMAPLAPGRKNVMVSYRLPVAVARPRWAAPVDTLDVLIEEPNAVVRGAGLSPVSPTTLMGSTLQRWTAAPPTGREAEVQFSTRGAVPAGVLALLVGLVAAGLLGGGFYLFRRRESPDAADTTRGDDPIAELARLDARYAEGPDQVPPAEWEEYQRERERLKTIALARRRARP